MKSKKILPILLATFSCLQSVSALENKQKQAVVGSNSNNKNSPAETMNPLASGAIGFVTGAGTVGLLSGLGVRHIKNKEIDTEKNKVTSLTADRDQWKKKYKDVEKKWQSVRDILLTEPGDDQATDDEVLDSLKITKKARDRILKACGFYQAVASSMRLGKELFQDCGPAAANLPLSIRIYFKPITNFKNLTDGGFDNLGYYARAMTAIVEYMLLPDNDPSLSIVNNYKITDENIANCPLKLKF